jgi:phage terminase small subunit
MTPRQQSFVKHYLKTGNASEACRRAGYKSKPNVMGSQLLANPSIRKVLNMAAERAKWDQDRVLARAERLLDKAEHEGRIGEGCRTLELIAKVAGLMTEARPNPENRPEDMNEDELKARIRQALEDVERGAGTPPAGPAKSDSLH